MSAQKQTEQEEEGKHHHYQPPLSSLIHPHLHSILVISSELGLAEPRWSASKPDEKRSESSDKTITPSSSSTIKASSSRSHSGEERLRASSSQSSLPKQRMLQSSGGSKQSTPSSPRRSSDSNREGAYDALTTEGSRTNTVMLSPASERSQLDLSSSPPKRDSRESSPASSKRSSSDKKKKDAESSRPKTTNELWVQVADAVKVVADALRDEELREPMGKTSFVIHLLTLFSLTMTQHDAPLSSPVPQNAAQASKTHKRGSSAESSLSEAAAKLDGINMAQVQCLRSLANLCIDHDDNRSELIAHDVPLFVLRLIKNTLESSPSTDGCFDTPTLLLLKTAMGALLNLQLDHSESRRWLLKLPPAGSKRFSHHHNGGDKEGLTEEDHRAAHPNWHNSHRQAHASNPNRPEGGGGPFDMPEAGTILTLIEVATDSRIYSPGLALRSILGQDPKEEGQVEWQPPSGQWDRVESGAEVASWAARIIEDLLSFELAEAKAAQGGGDEIDTSMLTLFSKTALASHDQAWTWLPRALRGFMPAGGSHPADSSPPLQDPDSDGPEDAAPFLDADLTILSLCGELLEACANIYQGNAPAATRFKRNGLPKLDELLTFIENGTSPFGTNATPAPGLLEQYGLEVEDVAMMAKEVSRAKANAVKAVVSLVSEDENMAELFGNGGSSPFLQRMKTWLQIDRSKREDLVSCALLSVANLARSDANCVSLVKEHDLVPLLVSLLRGKSSMLLSHAALGLLKNLCIPVANKQVIGASGIFNSLSSFLTKDKDHAQPIQFAAVGIAKHLAYSPGGGMERNVTAICQPGKEGKKSTLDALLDLVNRTEDTPTKLEATRVLVNVIRTLWASSNKETQHAEEDEIDLSDARTRIGDSKVIDALCDMLRRGNKYPILLNEAIIGLTLLASSESPERAATIANALLGKQSHGRNSDDPTALEGEDKSTPPSGAQANAQDLLNRAPPARSSTMDSMMSTYSSTTVTAPSDSAADVLYEVLSQASPSSGSSPGSAEQGAKKGRDIPIEFAENTCTLLSTLVGGSQSGRGDAGKDLSIKLLPALRGLKSRTAGTGRESTSKAVQRALSSTEGAIKQDSES